MSIDTDYKEKEYECMALVKAIVNYLHTISTTIFITVECSMLLSVISDSYKKS